MSTRVSVNETDIDRCLLGEKLYGDDFMPEEIDAWFRDEQEGYYNLGAKDRASYRYLHHALDWMHGFSVLPRKSFQHVLGIGSAYGDEFLPIASGAGRITILEPSEGFVVKDIRGTSVEYVKPAPNARMPFADSSFDLITCLSVLHHIPNVSAVIGEVFRCLEPGGFALIREPVVSMGDWRRPRKGLTSRERGIPLPLLRKMISQAGFHVLRESACVFNSRFWTYADAVVSRFPVWPERYHATRWFHKLRPAAAFFVLEKSSIVARREAMELRST
jgi:SAM-dependent methyltransferase